MDISVEEYKKKLEKLEQQAAKNPGPYRFFVLLFALFGYLFIALTLAVPLAMSLFFGAFLVMDFSLESFKISLIGLLPFCSLLITFSALRVKIDPPEGELILEEDFPKLFSRIEEIRKKVHAPYLHHVVLTTELNASLIAIPRWVWGWNQNYLVLGSMLLVSLTPEELESVIAHELGHLSSKHNKTSTWIYRIRTTWMQLVSIQQGWVTSHFFNWYIPLFERYSFVLARSHEYEADKIAASVTSVRVTGDALVRVNIGGLHLQETFWPGIHRLQMKKPTPPDDVYQQMIQALSASTDPEVVDLYLKKVLATKAGFHDTHPSLFDRLTSLNYTPNALAPNKNNASKFYFMDGIIENVSRVHSREWADDNHNSWTQSFKDNQKRHARFQVLEEQKKNLELPDNDLWEYWYLLEGEGVSPEKRIAVLHEFLDGNPNCHDEANFNLGQLLLEADNEEGLVFLQRVGDAGDPDFIEIACRVAMDYCFDYKELRDLQLWSDKLDLHLETYQAALYERSQILNNDTFMPPVDLSPEVIQTIHDAIDPFTPHHDVYLAEKILNHYRDIPCYVLAIGKAVGPFTLKIGVPISSLIDIPLPIVVIWFDMKNTGAGKKIKKIGLKIIDSNQPI